MAATVDLELGGDLASRIDPCADVCALIAEQLAEDLPLAVAAGNVAADPESLERLRGLGYLGGSARPAANDRGVDPKDKIEAYESFTKGFEDATEAVRAGRWDFAESQLRELDRIAPDQRHWTVVRPWPALTFAFIVWLAGGDIVPPVAETRPQRQNRPSRP